MPGRSDFMQPHKKLVEVGKLTGVKSMANPFPGMNPYLESPDFLPEVHNRLIVAIADALVPQLIPKYRVVYDRAGYDFTLDYTPDPVPALSESDAVWADAWLRERGLRS